MSRKSQCQAGRVERDDLKSLRRSSSSTTAMALALKPRPVDPEMVTMDFMRPSHFGRSILAG
jgi:hypothetical protein